MAAAAGTTRSSRGLPKWLASRTRVARNRLPPASIRWVDASASSSSSAREASAS